VATWVGSLATTVAGIVAPFKEDFRTLWRRSSLLAPGVYRLELRVAAANSRPVSKMLEISVTGQWFDEEKKIFAEGIGLREVS